MLRVPVPGAPLTWRTPRGPDDFVVGQRSERSAMTVRSGVAFYAALKRAGLADRPERKDPFVFHDLRHTFGTLAVQAWPLHDVQGIGPREHSDYDALPPPPAEGRRRG